jgi:proteasome beta subunit
VTVVVAVKCADGVVLATDSQGTTQMVGGMPMKLPAKKIGRLGKHVVFGGTGSQGAGQRIQAALENQASKLNVGKRQSEIAEIIRRTANPLQKQIRQEWVELPKTEPESWGAIFCGWSSDGPWIFEIDPTGPSQFQDPFAATGSGHPLAHTALVSVAHFNVAQQSLAGAKAIAYRAIENTCLAAAYGVGMPVQLAVVTKDGTEEINTGDPGHTELSDLIDLWKMKEVETLGQLSPAPAQVEVLVHDEGSGDEPEPSIEESEIGSDNASATGT